jgi:hypothetical protein
MTHNTGALITAAGDLLLIAAILYIDWKPFRPLRRALLDIWTTLYRLTGIPHRQERRELAELIRRWRARQSQPHRLTVLPPSSAVSFGGVSMAAAAANLSALACPTFHANTVPVELNTGEHVATLCTDCDTQLPTTWKPSTP